MSSESESTALTRLQESVIDGRTDNLRHRQTQLQSLHATLRTAAADLTAAIAADNTWTPAEVEAEYYLAMEAVRHAYSTVADFAGALKREYSVAEGRDFAERRVGVGIVVLRPGRHSRVYSVVAPLAAALAAGNCVILELADTLHQTDTLLRTLLTTALDPNTFTIIKSSLPQDHPLLTSFPNALVDQTATSNSNTPSSPTTQLLASPSTTARAIAIVDRTADIDAAARAITTARFGFGGGSPYAPDLVLVNEFVKQAFFEACSRYASLAFAGEKSGGKGGERSEETQKAVEEAEGRGEVVGFGSTAFKLVDVLDKDSSITKLKISGRYLPIATCSSLTDAIYNQEFETPILAGYFFATPKAAKFLAQFLPANLALINQIPTHLLIGPAAPTTTAHTPDYLYRYSPDMFSVPRPQFVEPAPPVFQKVEEVLTHNGQNGKTTSTTTAILRQAAVQPLPPTKQPSNKGTGFFEAGVLTGFSIYLTVVLPVMGYTTYFLGRKGVEYASRFRS